LALRSTDIITAHCASPVTAATTFVVTTTSVAFYD
jgi:hypothetical protein